MMSVFVNVPHNEWGHLLHKTNAFLLTLALTYFLKLKEEKEQHKKKAAVKICVEEYHCSSELLVAVNNSCYSEEWHKTEYLICFSQSCLR